jgi:hypothetical protein
LPEQRFFWVLIEGFLSINLGEVEEKGSFKGVFGFKSKKCGQKKRWIIIKDCEVSHGRKNKTWHQRVFNGRAGPLEWRTCKGPIPDRHTGSIRGIRAGMP